LVARGATPKPPALAHAGTETEAESAQVSARRAYFGDGFVETPVYDGTRLAPGAQLSGPALVEEPFTVVVLAPGDTCRLDEHGNYDIAVGG
ncbi:MAG: hydantoinase/oxoprolinase family protein, partial [Actinomycetota bacterium]|nr:hydantoinase/oxoprolinase family protein [Actinomycetota bacterium]